MDKTLTIRLPKAQDDALGARARAAGKTKSALVRELVDAALTERPLSHRIGHLKGEVALQPAKSGWRRQLRERNWR